MRRLVTLLAAVTLLVTCLPAFAAKEFDGITLNVSSFGGGFDEVLKATVATPLKEKYGLTVVYHPGTGLQSIAKVMAARDQPPLDVLMIDSPSMPTVIEAGIVEPITEQDVPSLRSLHRQGREFGAYGAGFCFAPLVMSYNTQRVKTPPAAFADLARPEYKGRAAMFNLENNGGVLTLLALAESSGGGVNNVAPGFAKLREIKPNLVSTPSAPPALAQLFQQGEAWVAANWLGRVLALQADGFPVEVVVPREGLYAMVTYVNVVKNTKVRAAALKYVEQQISAEASLGMAQKFFYAPTNASVKLPDDLARKVLLYGDNLTKIKVADWAAVAKNRGAWIEQWNREMGQ
ncbi:MAG TPA: ABC transporter substrate-binding protein [Candidatus Methylomirabilis sp.]|nr:ABC transporter substrate-binding protein [Candidatus Methylomirabilis sp.]